MSSRSEEEADLSAMLCRELARCGIRGQLSRLPPFKTDSSLPSGLADLLKQLDQAEADYGAPSFASSRNGLHRG